MERRSETRFPVNQPVRLTVLEESSSHPVPFEALLQNLSPGGFQISCGSRVEPGTAIRVDLPLDGRSALLLGEVRYCRAEGDKFGWGVSLEHSILDMGGLERLRSRLSQAARTSEPADVEVS